MLNEIMITEKVIAVTKSTTPISVIIRELTTVTIRMFLLALTKTSILLICLQTIEKYNL